ncbi:hypothetical protein GQ54DRAFT_141578 [Martensiomyces pterosporus]|nr:hypothetical protein GQ54DRAFT_141578 [Martensiomyces pterosporus]
MDVPVLHCHSVALGGITGFAGWLAGTPCTTRPFSTIAANSCLCISHAQAAASTLGHRRWLLAANAPRRSSVLCGWRLLCASSTPGWRTKWHLQIRLLEQQGDELKIPRGIRRWILLQPIRGVGDRANTGVDEQRWHMSGSRTGMINAFFSGGGMVCAHNTKQSKSRHRMQQAVACSFFLAQLTTWAAQHKQWQNSRWRSSHNTETRRPCYVSRALFYA